MLPIPFVDHIPGTLADNANAAMTALCNKATTHIETWRDDILFMLNFRRPAMVPATLLYELDYYLSSGFKQYDTERTKRLKIATSILAHKKRGSWANDAKVRIDSITEIYSSSLFAAGGDSDDCVEYAYLSSEPSYYWSTESSYSGDASLGTYEVGDMTEPVVAGNVCINCHYGVLTDVLTAAQIAQIVYEIQDDVVPAYYRVFLGYVNALGQFIKYAGGQIH